MALNRKKYFYCGSTQSVLYAIAHEDYVIISPTLVAKKLCEVYNRELIEIKIDVSLKNIIKHPKKIKNEISKLIRSIEDGELHFSHVLFAVFCFIIVDRTLKQRIPVVFHDFEVEYSKPKRIDKTPINLKIYIKKKIIELIYNIDLSFKYVNNTLVISLDNNYCKEQGIKTINDKHSYYKQTLDLFLQAPKTSLTYSHIFLTQNLLKYKLFPREELLSLYAFLKEQKVTVKYHPGMNEDETALFERSDVLNYDLPIEFLYNSIGRTVLSVHSSALITASMFSHLKSISLLDLLTPFDKTFFNDVKKDLLEKSGGKIFFPRSYEELYSLIGI